MKKLIPIGQRVLELEETIIYASVSEKKYLMSMGRAYDKSRHYAKFCNLEINIGMFIPAKYENGKWVVLEMPKNYDKWVKKSLNTSYNANLYLYEQYQEAEKNVLFEGARVDYCKINESIGVEFEYTTFYLKEFPQLVIEDLIGCGITLTKQGEVLSGL